MKWELYEQRLNLNGETRRDRTINEYKRVLNQKLPENPSYKELTIDNKNMFCAVIDTDIISKKKIKSMPNERFNRGSLVQFKNSFWLITDKDVDDEIYSIGIMEQCNILLRWQNKITYEIIERWVTCRSPYSNDLDVNNMITSPNAKFKIQIQKDFETELLHLDGGDANRFLIGIQNNKPLAWKIVKLDTISGVYSNENDTGFITFHIESDDLQTNDNADLMIADYIEPPVEPPTPEPFDTKITWKYSPAPCEMIIGGSTMIFTGRVYDDNGVEVDDVSGYTFNWILEDLVGGDVVRFLTIESTLINNQYKVKVPLNNNLDGKSFLIKINVTDNNNVNTFNDSDIIVRCTKI